MSGTGAGRSRSGTDADRAPVRRGVGRSAVWPVVVWAVTRLVLLLFVLRVLVFPGADVTTDVSVTYRGWFEVLRTGVFPADDVTWQYPPAAALAVLSPAVLPFLDYSHAFFALAFLADLTVLGLLLYAGRRPGRQPHGAWLWVLGLPLLGPTAYARYDLMVTAVAVAALLAGARRPRLAGALAGFGAMLKVWPVLLLVGAVRRRAWVSAAVCAGVLAALFLTAMPGAFAFLTFQRERGTEVESLGALVFHVARHFGWQGEVMFNYGSVEYLGPYVDMVSTLALALTGAAFGWLVLWRSRVVRLRAHTLADAAFTAVLMFTTTSRVLSPQYLVWLLGLAAVCLCFRAGRMVLPARLVVAAAAVTVLEFPIGFAHVVAGDRYGTGLLLVRNGLLVAASVLAACELWRSTVTEPPVTLPAQAARTREGSVSS